MINTFDNSRRGWDRYNAFYSQDSWGFVSFETGEVIYTRSKLDPEERKFYPDVNVTLTATGDDYGITYLHPETGKKIPKAQLLYSGIQYLLVDHDTNRAVKLDRQVNNNAFPKHLQNATALVLTDKGKLYGSPVNVNAPSVPTQEMLDWRMSVLALAKIRGTTGLQSRRYVRHVMRCSPSHTKILPHEFIDKAVKTYLSEDFYNILDFGIVFVRETQALEFLVVDIKKLGF